MKSVDTHKLTRASWAAGPQQQVFCFDRLDHKGTPLPLLSMYFKCVKGRCIKFYSAKYIKMRISYRYDSLGCFLLKRYKDIYLQKRYIKIYTYIYLYRYLLIYKDIYFKKKIILQSFSVCQYCVGPCPRIFIRLWKTVVKIYSKCSWNKKVLLTFIVRLVLV